MNDLTQYLHKAEDLVQEIMNKYEVAGLAVSLIDENNCLYERSWGYRDVEAQATIDGETIFGLASITKSFTAVAIMQLQERGLLNVDEAVSNYLPEFTNSTVKLRHLLSHCAGYFPLERILVLDVARKLGLNAGEKPDLAFHPELADLGFNLVVERLNRQTELIGTAGEALSYCNDGYALLTEIIRRYGGEASYSDYVTKNILRPLGMNRSCLDYDKPANDPNCARLYCVKDGKRQSSLNFYDNAFVLPGGGGMKSCLNDMKHYLRFHLSGGLGPDGTPILSTGSTSRMRTPVIHYQHGQDYGFGISCKKLDDLTVYGHGGSLPGVSSNFAWSPEIKLAVLVLCNSSDVPVAIIADAFIKAFNRKDPSAFSPEDEHLWTEERIREALGVYVSGEGTVLTLSLDGESKLQIKRGDTVLKYRMVAPDRLEIINQVGTGSLSFWKSADGQRTAIRYGGRLIPRKS